MKSYEQIAKAMYKAYRAAHIQKLAEWHQLSSMSRDCWLSAAEAAVKEMRTVHQEGVSDAA